MIFVGIAYRNMKIDFFFNFKLDVTLKTIIPSGHTEELNKYTYPYIHI